MAYTPRRPQRQQEDPTRINARITADKIRLIDADGQMVGVVSVSEGLEKAEAAGLDLVEVSPNAEPPVCKILDYGKYRYEAQKKAKEAKKKQKVIQVKEIKMRPGIDTHDYDTKMRAAKKFLAEGDKVKFSLRFRGREMAHKDLGFDVLERIAEDLKNIAEVELTARMEGRQATMIVIPVKAASA